MSLRAPRPGTLPSLALTAASLLAWTACRSGEPSPGEKPPPAVAARSVGGRTEAPTSTPVPPTAPPATPTVAPATPTAVAPTATPVRAAPATPTPTPAATATARPAPVRTAAAAPAPEKAVAVAAANGSLRVKLELLGPDQKVGPARDAVVWLPGVAAPPRPSAPKPAVKSEEKRFSPHVVAVTKGTTVAFPNVDKIYHNAFSRTAGSEFDLGLYRGGASKDARFDKPGLVRVFCNIHPQMAAYVMVLDDVAHGVTDATGSLVLPAVPPGKHQVRVWHEIAGERILDVEIRPGQETVVAERLDGSRFRPVPHKNKHGEDYPKGRGDERY